MMPGNRIELAAAAERRKWRREGVMISDLQQIRGGQQIRGMVESYKNCWGYRSFFAFKTSER
jgi:hypothetical protein